MSQRVSELDGIRGIACLMVLLDHCIISEIPFGTIPGLYRAAPWLIGGVDLFFVLSGFLIGGILLDHKGAQNYFRVFWARRIARIWPVYYLLIFSCFAVLAVKPYLHAPWLDDFLLKNMMPLWTYPTFLQNFAQAADGGDGGARWVASTWSLAIEEQFYLVLPPLIYFMSRRSVAAFAAACVFVALLVRAHLWQTTGSWFTGYFLLPGRMDSLACGLLAAMAVRNQAVLARLVRWRVVLDVCAVLTVLVLSANVLVPLGRHLPDTASFIVRSLDFTGRSVLFAYVIARVFLVAEGARYRRILAAPLLVFSGNISYALYMYHPAINGLIHGALFGRGPRVTNLKELAVALVVIAVSVALAWVSTTYMEMPIRRWSHRVRYGVSPQSLGTVRAA